MVGLIMAKVPKYLSIHSLIRYAAVFSVIAPIYFIGISTYASIITPDYSVISQAYSVLARHGMPNAVLMTTGFLGYALMIQTLGPLLFINIDNKSLGVVICVLVFIYGVSGIFASIYRDAGTQETIWELSEGSMHDLASRIGFFAILIVIILSIKAMNKNINTHLWKLFSIAVAILTIAFAISFGFRLFPNLIGLMQRGFFITIMLWVFVTAVISILIKINDAKKEPS